MVERSFAHVLDRGRYAPERAQALLMRAMFATGTLRQVRGPEARCCSSLKPDFEVMSAVDGETGMFVSSSKRNFVTGLLSSFGNSVPRRLNGVVRSNLFGKRYLSVYIANSSVFAR